MRPPRVMISDKLASYGAAKREIMPGIEHRQQKGLNNRAENSNQPTRRRERQMKQSKSAGQPQRFLSAHDQHPLAGQSPAMLMRLMPVILPWASKPIRRLAASPRGKMSFTR